jgi:hypothetical protein
VVFKQPLEVQLEALQHCYQRFQEAAAAFKAKCAPAPPTPLLLAMASGCHACRSSPTPHTLRDVATLGVEGMFAVVAMWW